MIENWYACILAGGKGERFWPKSTSAHPKQVLALSGDKPMLAEAVDRLEGLIPPERVLVITHADLATVCREVLPGVPAENVIGEPCGRDTAAACALAAAVVAQRDSQGVLAMLTADQVIRDGARFRAVLRASLLRAERERVIVTLGIRPTYPSTGFGYIACGAAEEEQGVRFCEALRFVEKPDLETAKGYLASGTYLWNGGMFIWHVDTLFEALERHVPVLRAMAAALMPYAGTAGFEEALRAAYAPLGRISIDYAVMEKAGNIITAESDFGWMDVGTWAALDTLHEPDENGNRVLGRATVLDSHGNFVWSEDRLTAMIGVEDLVVVHTGEVTLICPKSRSEEVKNLVQQLAAQGDCNDLL